MTNVDHQAPYDASQDLAVQWTYARRVTYAGLSEWPEPPVHGDEIATLLGSLDRQRATFAWKTSGLGAEGLRARVGASSVTLGGLLKHLALVEDYYFSVRLFDREHAAAFNALDWESDADSEWGRGFGVGVSLC